MVTLISSASVPSGLPSITITVNSSVPLQSESTGTPVNVIWSPLTIQLIFNEGTHKKLKGSSSTSVPETVIVRESPSSKSRSPTGSNTGGLFANAKLKKNPANNIVNIFFNIVVLLM